MVIVNPGKSGKYKKGDDDVVVDGAISIDELKKMNDAEQHKTLMDIVKNINLKKKEVDEAAERVKKESEAFVEREKDIIRDCNKITWALVIFFIIAIILLGMYLHSFTSKNEIIKKAAADKKAWEEKIGIKDGIIAGNEQKIKDAVAEAISAKDKEIEELKSSVAIKDGEIKELKSAIAAKDKKLSFMGGQLSKAVVERKTISSSQKASSLPIQQKAQKAEVRQVDTLLDWPRNPKEKYFPLGEIEGIKVVGNKDNPKYPANSVSLKKEYHEGTWDPRIIIRNATVNPQIFFSAEFLWEMKKYLAEIDKKNVGQPGQEGDSCCERTWVAKIE